MYISELELGIPCLFAVFDMIIGKITFYYIFGFSCVTLAIKLLYKPIFLH